MSKPFAPATVAEQLLALLGAHGIEHFFLNPGTDSAPLQEAMRTLPEAGVAIPAVHSSTFEAVSLAAAHAYYQVSGKPQCLFVHVDAGTQNLGAMMHDAYRDRAGVIIIAGKTPYGEDAESRGGRNGYIQWLQDVPDQAGIVRPYTKACIEITRADMLDRAIGRAVQLATSYPAGPVYLTVSRDVLMDEPIAGPLRSTGYAVPAPPAMPAREVDEIADLLADARRPLLITSRIGRTPQGFAATQRLAELLGMEVIRGADAGPANIPTLHPLHHRSPATKAAAIRAADVIVIAECEVPWIPKFVHPAEGAVVVHIDADTLKASMSLWAFPVDRAATADGATALNQLADALEQRAQNDPALAFRWRERAEAAVAEPVFSGPPQDPNKLVPLDVFAALNAVLRDDDVVVEEAVTNAVVLYEHLVRREAGSIRGPFAPGLGWALGGAIGVKLAQPERRVISVVGDGSLLFGVPTSALMMAAAMGTPFLAVVLDNGGYRASRLPVYELFPEGSSALAETAAGTRFDHAPDYAALAAACHAHGERVTHHDDLEAALRRGLAATEQGQVALVDVFVNQN